MNEKIEDKKRLEIISKKLHILSENSQSALNKLNNFGAKVFGFPSGSRAIQVSSDEECLIDKILGYLDTIDENLSDIDIIINNLNSEIDWREE